LGLTQDNEQRKLQEEKAAARRKQQEMMKSEKKSGKQLSILLSVCLTYCVQFNKLMVRRILQHKAIYNYCTSISVNAHYSYKAVGPVCRTGRIRVKGK